MEKRITTVTTAVHVEKGPTVKIVAYKGQYRITLPKDLVKDQGWNSGTELRFVEDTEGRIFLKPIHKTEDG